MLGLTAKPGTDDMRGSQAVPFIEVLQKEGATVKVFDPMGMENAKKLLSEVEFCSDVYQAAKAVDALCILCEWHEFEGLDWKKIGKLMRGNLIFDAKRMFDPEKLQKLGFKYFGVGK